MAGLPSPFSAPQGPRSSAIKGDLQFLLAPCPGKKLPLAEVSWMGGGVPIREGTGRPDIGAAYHSLAMTLDC